MSKQARQIAAAVQVLLRLSRGRLSLGWVLLLAALLVGYLIAQPHLERSLGVSLPGLPQADAERSEAPDDTGWSAQDPAETGSAPPTSTRTAGAPQPVAEDLEALLRELGSRPFESPAGLRYTRGSVHGHRLKHVMAHTVDDPDRPGPHGVFGSADLGEVLRLIDEAYEQALTGRRTRTAREEGRTRHTVDLGRRIGFVGGQTGARRGRPATNHVRIILQGKNVITAYPILP